MIAEVPTLVRLLRRIDQMPLAEPLPHRGRPPRYSDRLFLNAVVVMVVRRLPTVHLLLSVLEQPTAEMQQLRALLCEDGRFPSRRTWERRFARLPEVLPAQIGWLGRELTERIQPWQACGRAAAIDSTVVPARGGVWHRKHRDAGIVPHTSSDTEAHWTKSGWHGWVYGWKLHVVTTVASVWIPLAAQLTPANVADNELAPSLLAHLPADLRFLLGDTAYQDPDLAGCCAQRDLILIASRRGPYPHTDDGVAVRRAFHQSAPTRSRTATASSRRSSTCRHPSRPAACAPPAASSLAPSSSTNSPSGSASTRAMTPASGSSPFSAPPTEL